MGVLAHAATKVFLSHCGINSVHESVYLATKLLCIPILADQAVDAMAAKLARSSRTTATFDGK
jgi:UDP:flavonoid glycosyltransferase YjiC (YdhE family)